MRALTDGRVRWGFWPPGSADREGVGIWLEGTGIEDADEDEEEDEKDQGPEGRDGRDDSDKDATSEEEEVEEDESEKGKAVEGKEEKAVVKPSVGGFFAALEMDSGEEDVSEEEADEEHEGQHEAMIPRTFIP
jgi:hypothetical protein